MDDKRTDKSKITEEANRACHLPANKNGPDLDKGGKKRTNDEATSDFA